MEFTVYQHWQLLPTAAQSLLAEYERDSVFVSYPWMQLASSEVFCQPDTVRLACVVDGGNFLAILPLSQSDEGYYRALSNPLSPFFTLLVSKQAVQHSVINCLVRGLASMADSIRIDPINSADLVVSRFSKVMRTYGYQSYPFFRFYNWHHTLHGELFQQYMAARPARLRNTIARKQRKLLREYGYTICLYTDKNINQAWQHYQKVYRASWKADDTYLEVIANFIRSSAEHGWLRLAILYIGEQPIAAQIWIVAHKKANIFRLAHDEKWNSYSPGSIVTEFLMRHVIDTDKVTEIDFLIGNERYKQDWMTTRTEKTGLRFQKVCTRKNRWAALFTTLKNLVCN